MGRGISIGGRASAGASSSRSKAPLLACRLKLPRASGRISAAGTGRASIQPTNSDGRSSPVRSIGITRSEEHTSELQSLMRHSYAVFCLKKKNINDNNDYNLILTCYSLKSPIQHQ